MRAPATVGLMVLLAAGLCLAHDVQPLVNQNRTLTELKYEEVLTNLAMLHGRNLRRGPLSPPGSVAAEAAPKASPLPYVLQFDYLCQSEADPLGPHPGGTVLDPEKLLLLEYAYQKALGFRFDIPVEEKLAAFFGPRARLYAALQSRWYCVGKPKRVPPPNAIYVGEYDGLYTWVYSYNLASLAEFTFALEYIVHAPPQP